MGEKKIESEIIINHAHIYWKTNEKKKMNKRLGKWWKKTNKKTKKKTNKVVFAFHTSDNIKKKKLFMSYCK